MSNKTEDKFQSHQNTSVIYISKKKILKLEHLKMADDDDDEEEEEEKRLIDLLCRHFSCSLVINKKI